MKKRALLSVSDKTGIIEFAKGLTALGFEILSTGGTAAALTQNGIANIQVSDITGFPECLDGRVKTLHPKIHAGILSLRSNPEHMRTLEKLEINTIDVVAVNLYPFKETIIKPNCTFGDAVENIDIGGPSMIRAAAKNYADVAVLVDSADYGKVLQELNSGGIALDTKKHLMLKAFSHTAVYDSMIANYLASQAGVDYPDEFTMAFNKKQDLRYGENPHQSGAFYEDAIPSMSSLARAVQLQGKELSYNNINDAGGALDLLNEFDACACVAIKHANPCGVAIAKTPLAAYSAAYEADPVSIFGGIVAFNRTVDDKTAALLTKIFLEIIIAPSYTKEALEVLAAKPNLRVLKIDGLENRVCVKNMLDLKRVYGGLLVQGKDASTFEKADFKVVTKIKPSQAQLEELTFAYSVVKHTKSNAIVLTKDGKTVGLGSGQTNRIWAANQAIEHAGENANGSVMASDAFFPFGDCVEVAQKAGVKAIIQPGGSIRDQESIDLCDKYGIAMVFVGQRHFKH